MPVTGLTVIDAHNEPSFLGYRWEISACDDLAELVARLVVGQYLYVSKIIQGLRGLKLSLTATSKQRRINQIGNPSGKKQVEQRDGWIFQMISWIAAHEAGVKYITPPHSQPAFKGFDSVMLKVSDDGLRIEGVVVGEDKATINARKTITDKVWPEIRKLETEVRDDELVELVTSLLSRYFPEDVERHLAATFWRNDTRAYRVCIGSHDFDDSSNGRSSLFAGFVEVAPGSTVRRLTETLYTSIGIRPWMAKFSELVVAKLEKMYAQDG